MAAAAPTSCRQGGGELGERCRAGRGQPARCGRFVKPASQPAGHGRPGFPRQVRTRVLISTTHDLSWRSCLPACLQKDRQLPANYADVPAGARCCAVDGDSDRLMYFTPLADTPGKGACVAWQGGPDVMCTGFCVGGQAGGAGLGEVEALPPPQSLLPDGRAAGHPSHLPNPPRLVPPLPLPPPPFSPAV